MRQKIIILLCSASCLIATGVHTSPPELSMSTALVIEQAVSAIYAGLAVVALIVGAISWVPFVHM